MNEFYLSLDNHTNEMTLSNYKKTLDKIIHKINFIKNPNYRIPVYIMSLKNIWERQLLLEEVIEYLYKHSKNKLNILVMSNDNFLNTKSQSLSFATNIIDKYKITNHIDVYLSIKIDDDIIDSHDKLYVLRLFKATHKKFLKLWMKVEEDNLHKIPSVIEKLDGLKLLSITDITFNLAQYDKLSNKIKDTLKMIPIYILRYLVDRYIESFIKWNNMHSECYDYKGELIYNCPYWSDCVLVARKTNERQMATLLVDLVKDLGNDSNEKENENKN